MAGARSSGRRHSVNDGEAEFSGFLAGMVAVDGDLGALSAAACDDWR